LKIQNPFTILENKQLKEFPQYREEQWKPRQYSSYQKEKKPIVLSDSFINWKIIKDQTKENLINKSFICPAGGGFGKSTLLVELNEPNTIVLCYTNKACDSLRKKGLEEVFTFDSYFKEKECIPDIIKKIQIDEFSMMPTSWVKLIYKLKIKNPELIVQMYGDPNQCKQVCKHNRHFEYLGKKCIASICDYNVVVKQYIEESARYDKELYEVLEYLLKYGKMHPKLKNRPINNELETNIIRNNNLRDSINNKFAKEWFVGMKIIGDQYNDKTKGIFNSKMYYVTDIDGDKIQFANKKGGNPYECGFVPKRHFLPAYACTVYKYQGDTIKEPFNIQQASIMDRNELYTAISRGQGLDQIHIEYNDQYYKKAKEPKEATKMKIEKANTGYIYHLFNNKENKSYIGMTTNTIEKRFQEHLNKKDDPIHKFDGEWNFEEISKVHYFNEKTLKRIEKKYIMWYNDNKYDLINTQNIEKIENKLSNKICVGNYDEKLKEQFKIQECKGYYRIQYQLNGIKKDVKKCYGPRKCKEDAFKEIKEVQNELILSFS